MLYPRRNIHYLVTPSGIEPIAKQSYRYLRRTVGNIVRYKERFTAWLREQHGAGITTVVLVGPSDIDFLIQWCVENEGLRYEHRAAAPDELDSPGEDEAASFPRSGLQPDPRTVVVLSETVAIADASAAPLPGTVTLASILIIRDR